MLKFLREQLRQLQEQRAALITAMDEVVAAPTREQRALTDDETKTFDETRAKVLAKDEEIGAAERRIGELEQIEERSRKAAKATEGGDGERRGGEPARITYEPKVYDRHQRHSYFLDLARAELNMGDGDGGPAAARERLQRHAKELEVELPAREQRRDEAAQRELRSIDGVQARHRESVFEKRVNPNRTDGQGGYFVPPLWLVDQFIDLPRFGRVIANSVRNLTLPGGTDSVNIPKVNTGTATGVQTADGGPVTSQDMTDTFVTSRVNTIAGQQDIAIQLLDQSPISYDEVVFPDLMGDYNQRLDLQCINGPGTGGQHLGMLLVPGINSVTYTDASPTLPELWPALTQAASQVAKNRKLPPLAMFSIPSIWWWALSALDTTNRPLVTAAPGAFNPAALQTGGDATEGYVGNWSFGLPHLNDGNIPSTFGAGSNETRIITARTSDSFLWEGTMRSRVLQEVLSSTLQVRLQIFCYSAFMAHRRPESIAVIGGTGLIPAAGF